VHPGFCGKRPEVSGLKDGAEEADSVSVLRYVKSEGLPLLIDLQLEILEECSFEISSSRMRMLAQGSSFVINRLRNLIFGVILLKLHRKFGLFSYNENYKFHLKP
jgi:hypothetical protein